jgi:hypothetical protein
MVAVKCWASFPARSTAAQMFATRHTAPVERCLLGPRRSRARKHRGASIRAAQCGRSVPRQRHAGALRDPSQTRLRSDQRRLLGPGRASACENPCHPIIDPVRLVPRRTVFGHLVSVPANPETAGPPLIQRLARTAASGAM